MATFLDKFQLTPDEIVALRGTPTAGLRMGMRYALFTIFQKKTAPPYVKVHLLINIIQFDCSDDYLHFVWRTPADITAAMRLSMLS